MSEFNRRVLVIDDNQAIHDDFNKVLSVTTSESEAMLRAVEAVFEGQTETAAEAFEIHHAHQGEEGLAKIEEALKNGKPFALTFVDGRMPPGWDGVETITKIWKVDPEVQTVLCTAFSDYSLAEIQQKLGQSDRFLILKKPFDPVAMTQLATSLATRWQRLRESKQRLSSLETMVKSRTSEVALVVSGIALPGTMNGVELMSALGRIEPEERIVASSALTRDLMESLSSKELSDLRVNTFLMKPYTASSILKTLQAALKEKADKSKTAGVEQTREAEARLAATGRISPP